MSLTIRILGLDPGLAQMGWGVIDVSGSRLAHVAHGVIVTKPAAGLGVRLMTLHRELGAVSALRRPAPLAVERPFASPAPQAPPHRGPPRAGRLQGGAHARSV